MSNPRLGIRRERGGGEDLPLEKGRVGFVVYAEFER